MKSNLQLAKDYLGALERGTSRELLAAYFSPELAQEIHPNRLLEAGARRSLEELLDADVAARKLFASQRFELRNAIASGDTVVLEVAWSGTVAAKFDGLQAGEKMRAQLGLFLEFRGGRIVKQRNYECFSAF